MFVQLWITNKYKCARMNENEQKCVIFDILYIYTIFVPFLHTIYITLYWFHFGDADKNKNNKKANMYK